MNKVVILAIIVLLIGCSLPEDHRDEDAHFEKVIERELGNRPGWANSDKNGVKNILVKCKSVNVDSARLNQLRVGLKWRSQREQAQLGNLQPQRRGLSVAVATNNFLARLGLRRGRSRNTRSVAQYITVMDGAEGMIHVGRTFYTPLTYHTHSHRHRIPVQQQVGESLLVAPRIIKGNIIEVRLRKVSARRGTGPGAIRQQGASTIVRVASGQPIVIGGMTASANSSYCSYVNGRMVGNSGQNVVILTPKIIN